MDFGSQLRSWRKLRGLSQLDLAFQASTTPRYVSFLETGRSRPGEDIVLRLADALCVPLRDRNTLLKAAGLPPAYPEHALQDEAMGAVRAVVEQLMANHAPYPAWCIGRGLKVLDTNEAAAALFPGLAEMAPLDLVSLWLEPGPFREWVENWPEVARAGVQVMRRELLMAPDPALEEALAFAEPRVARLPRSAEPAELPVACPILRVDGQRIRTLTSVVRFDNAIDVGAAELRVELMFPVDDVGVAFFERLGSAKR